MTRHQSAYAALGLRPGADRAEIERAYRRLIKKHHPDTGGDGERAAEIIHAYRELSRQPLVQVAPAVATWEVRQRPRFGRMFVGAASIAALVLLSSSGSWPQWHGFSGEQRQVAAPSPAAAATMVPTNDPLDEPISESLIGSAIAQAIRLYSAGDRQSLYDYSRSCHMAFGQRPSVPSFDSCVAFDETVLLLDSNAVDADSGPFSTPLITSRQLSEGRALTDDYLAIDSRLQRIRSRVDLTILPRLDPAMSAAAGG